jgi:hypothetical protein
MLTIEELLERSKSQPSRFAHLLKNPTQATVASGSTNG